MNVMNRIATERLVSHAIEESGEGVHKTFTVYFTYESGLIVSMEGVKGGNWKVVHDPKA